MPSYFDASIAVERAGDGRYRAQVTDHWNIGNIPNGGYLLSLATAAMRADLPHPDPFSVSGHFFKPADCAPVEIAVSRLKQGKALSYAQALLIQNGEERLRVTGVFGRYADRNGIDHHAIPAQQLPPPDRCERATMPFKFSRHMHVDLAPDSAAWLRGTLDDRCELAGWAAFADDPAPDALALPLFADAFPPPVLRRIGPVGWVPTVEMTVQCFHAPAPGPLNCHFASDHIAAGIAVEDGRLWDGEGRLVALSRQLASVRTR